MLQFFYDYIRHRLQSNTRHGTHSPFVYRLLEEVIYDHRPNASYHEIEDLRKALYRDDREITITDLGAGSQLNNNRRKKVSVLAKNALKSPKLAQLIFRLASKYGTRSSIELGTCLGITTAYLAKAAPGGQVISVEGCPQTAAVAKENLERLGCRNVNLLVGNFDVLFPGVVQDAAQLDFVFIDGNHRKQATLAYFEECLAKVHDDSLLIFDDIYWSKGMKEAWEQIKSHPQVTLTIDLFWIGLVFFKKGQAKEHFKIKY